MDNFFTQKHCDRCSKDLKHGRIMSMFNTDCICLECADKEKTDKDYKKAASADAEKIKQGNYNYQGIRGSSPNTTFFVRKAVDLDEVKDVYYSNKGKRPGEKYIVAKVIELSRQAFEQFSNNLLDDYDFIKENVGLMYEDKENVRHCLLVKTAEAEDEYLIFSSGYGYARYIAYCPDMERGM